MNNMRHYVARVKHKIVPAKTTVYRPVRAAMKSIASAQKLGRREECVSAEPTEVSVVL